MDDQKVSRKSRKTVNAKLGWYLHLTTYVILNSLLITINYITSPQYLWFLWIVLGWGVGLCFHAVILFMFYGPSSIKEQMLKKEMERELKGKNDFVKN